MGAQGKTTIDFGAFPGSDYATVGVTGQTGISGTSLVDAWIFPEATSDHTVDEHVMDPPQIVAGNVVAGTGFTIYGTAPRSQNPDTTSSGTGVAKENIEQNCRLHGVWTVAWVWN